MEAQKDGTVWELHGSMWENKEMGLPGQVDGLDYGRCLHSLRVYVVWGH